MTYSSYSNWWSTDICSTCSRLVGSQGFTPLEVEKSGLDRINARWVYASSPVGSSRGVPKSTGLDVKKIVEGCGWGVKGVEYGWNMSHSHSRDKTWRVESTIKHRSQLGSPRCLYGKAMAKMATTSYLHTAMLSIPVVRSRRSTSHCSPSCFSCWFERSWLERP